MPIPLNSDLESPQAAGPDADPVPELPADGLVVPYRFLASSVLRAIRFVRGTHVHEIARAISVSDAHWSRVELGGTAPSLDMLHALSAKIDHTPAEVCGFTDALAAQLTQVGIQVSGGETRQAGIPPEHVRWIRRRAVLVYRSRTPSPLHAIGDLLDDDGAVPPDVRPEGGTS